jgi:hypothetical protein
MDFRDLVEAPAEGRTSWYAKITQGATDLTDLVRIVIPEFDPELEWGPCRWQSRDSTSLPAAGDEALVVFDNRRNPWIVAWWPYT